RLAGSIAAQLHELKNLYATLPEEQIKPAAVAYAQRIHQAIHELPLEGATPEEGLEHFQFEKEMLTQLSLGVSGASAELAGRRRPRSRSLLRLPLKHRWNAEVVRGERKTKHLPAVSDDADVVARSPCGDHQGKKMLLARVSQSRRRR